jgi:hypothetical protein
MVDDPLIERYQTQIKNTDPSSSKVSNILFVTFPLYTPGTTERQGSLKLSVTNVVDDVAQNLNTYEFSFFLNDPPIVVTSDYIFVASADILTKPFRMTISSITGKYLCNKGTVYIVPVGMERQVTIKIQDK